VKHGDCSPWWGCNGRIEMAAAVVADDLGDGCCRGVGREEAADME
jgi:hypothetical protein